MGTWEEEKELAPSASLLREPQPGGRKAAHRSRLDGLPLARPPLGVFSTLGVEGVGGRVEVGGG